MAKMKTYAVDVQITVTETVYVDARREGGAVAALSTREGWSHALRYRDENDALRRVRSLNDPWVEVQRIRPV